MSPLPPPDFHLASAADQGDDPRMELMDPRKMPRAIHVIPRNGEWRVRWSDRRKALRILPMESAAIEFAKKLADGSFSVLVLTPNGFVDPQRSVMVSARSRSNATG